MAGWDAGDYVRVCVSWALSPFVGGVMDAVRWANAGQSIGALWEQTPAIVDALPVVKGEWTAIENERAERRAREAKRGNHRR